MTNELRQIFLPNMIAREQRVAEDRKEITRRLEEYVCSGNTRLGRITLGLDPKNDYDYVGLMSTETTADAYLQVLVTSLNPETADEVVLVPMECIFDVGLMEE
ncbi:MAG: hypothetical protein H9W81_16545 [Enterococcus sp.]|nr:hypothetical protein [Enterococcus sp.]